MSILTNVLAAAVAAGVVAALALRARALAPGGAIAAVVIGTLIVGTGGWWMGVTLIAFFLSSSLLSQRASDWAIHQDRGSRRDAWQVLANGGIATLCCAMRATTQDQLWLLAGLGAIAAATADTWSTELGRLCRTPPRLITTWRRAPKGTSGAVSALGLLSAAFGAAMIWLVAMIGMRFGLLSLEIGWLPLAGGIALGGLGGSLFDSLMGATVQERRWCDTCEKTTESVVHRCGSHTRVVGGMHYVNNDGVNVFCTIVGGMLAGLSGIL